MFFLIDSFLVFFFFFKQKTAYEMRISDWSSDVCSSDLCPGQSKTDRTNVQTAWQRGTVKVVCATIAYGMGIDKPDVRYVVHLSIAKSLEEIGRASCRERVCQYV